MIIGVTGTRSGMNDLQFEEVYEFLAAVKDTSDVIPALHHGDCVGVDVQVATIANELGFKVVCHPPTKSDLRAYHESDEFKEPLSYFARNRNIVDISDALIVIPYQNEWQSSGGTWYTHDYALKRNKPTIIFYPKGRE